LNCAYCDAERPYCVVTPGPRDHEPLEILHYPPGIDGPIPGWATWLCKDCMSAIHQLIETCWELVDDSSN